MDIYLTMPLSFFLSLWCLVSMNFRLLNYTGALDGAVAKFMERLFLCLVKLLDKQGQTLLSRLKYLFLFT